jgi:hypothetical protein
MRTPRHPAIRSRTGPAFRAALLGTAVAVVLASVGVAGGSSDIPLSGTGVAAVGASTLAAPRAASGGNFAITGNVAGLFPGASRSLVLSVFNPEPFTIVVTSVTTTVGSPSLQCPGTLMTVTPFSGKRSVPAHGAGQVTVTASLDHSAPNACQGVTFPFHYTGLAKKK